jgi:hypothetical protein
MKVSLKTLACMVSTKNFPEDEKMNSHDYCVAGLTFNLVILFFAGLIITCWSSCVLPQYRLDFDVNRNVLVSCDDRLKIRHVRIMDKDGEVLDTKYYLRKARLAVI